MKKITYHKAKGGFAKKSRAHYATLNNKKYYLPRSKIDREKIINRLEKKAARKSFNEKLREKGLRSVASPPTKARYFFIEKTLIKPGTKDETFDIVKSIYELNEPLNINQRNLPTKIRFLKNNAYPKFLEFYDNIKESGQFRDKKKKRWPAYLFRIDTAYTNKTDEFSKVDGVYKKDSSHKSDGRGYSLGRRLDVSKKKTLVQHMNDTFDAFLKSFEIYINTKGITVGQINALILEVS